MKANDNETLLDSVQEEEVSLFEELGFEDKTKDIEIIKSMAERGDKDAMMIVGNHYLDGDGVEQDFAEACYWYEKSEDAHGMIKIAAIHEQEGNKELAQEYYQRAIDAPTDKEGRFRADGCISRAIATMKNNPNQAEEYLKQAIAFGVSEESLGLIGRIAGILQTLFFSEKAYDKMVFWGTLALSGDMDEKAKEKLIIACEEYLKNEEAPLKENALNCLEQLANEGFRLAVMGLFIYWAEREKENPEQYKTWLIKAADSGIEFAQFTLARKYVADGIDKNFPLDPEKGLAYFKKCEEWVLKKENGEALRRNFYLTAEKKKRELAGEKLDSESGAKTQTKTIQSQQQKNVKTSATTMTQNTTVQNEKKSSSQGGIGALVCGILSLVIPSIPGIILGIIAVILASRAQKEGPNGKATAAKVCGSIGIVMSALTFALTSGLLH